MNKFKVGDKVKFSEIPEGTFTIVEKRNESTYVLEDILYLLALGYAGYSGEEKDLVLIKPKQDYTYGQLLSKLEGLEPNVKTI